MFVLKEYLYTHSTIYVFNIGITLIYKVDLSIDIFNIVETNHNIIKSHSSHVCTSTINWGKISFYKI